MDFVKAVPKTNPALSYNNLQLTPTEGYLLSRIDGVSSVDDIASLSGLPYDEALDVIKSLWNKKVFLINGLEPKSNGGNNDIELSEDERSAIEKMSDTVKNGTFYQILSVPFQVKPEQVKTKFFELSKLYHPDRYFKKNIGDYKGKLNMIFKKLSEAYEVLYDPQKKKWYDAALANPRPNASQFQEPLSSNNRKDHIMRSDNTEETVKSSVSRLIEPDRSMKRESTVKYEKPKTVEPTIDQKIALMEEKLDNNMLEQVLQEMDSMKNIRDSRIPLLIAHYYPKHNDLLSARDSTQTAIEFDAYNVEAYEMLGDIYMKFKLYRNALKVYETIKNIAPSDLHAELMIQEIKSFIED